MATVSLKKLFIQITPAKDKLPALARLLTVNFRGDVEKGALLFSDKNPEKAAAVVLYAKGVSSSAFSGAVKTSGLERPEVESLLKINHSLQLLETSNPSQTTYLQSNLAKVELVDKPDINQSNSTVALEGKNGKYTPSVDNFNPEKVDIANQMVSKEAVNSRMETAEMYDLPAERFDIPIIPTSTPTTETLSVPVSPDNASAGFTTAEAPQEPTNIPPAMSQSPTPPPGPSPRGAGVARNFASDVARGVTKGAKAIGKTIGNSIAPVIGGKIGEVVGGYLSKALTDPVGFLKDTLKYIAAATGLILGTILSVITAAIVQILAGFIFLSLLVVFILYIINTGAYVVPPGGYQTGGGFYPGGCVFGSCPIPNATILTGSMGSGLGVYEHGDNAYWNDQLCTGSAGCPSLACCSTSTVCDRWSLPVAVGPRCTRNNISGSYCYSANSQCPEYGLATDIMYPGGTCGPSAPVNFPHINGATLNWTRTFYIAGVQDSAIFQASDATNTYELYLTHLANIVTQGTSGQQLGNLSCNQMVTPHAHYELRINGNYIAPDSLCTGTTQNGCTPPPAGVVDCYEPGPYGPNYTPANLTTFVDPATGNARQVTQSIVSDLNGFVSGSASQGVTITIYSGYRTYQEQLALCLDCNAQKLVNPNAACLAAPASQSDHRNGRAVDVYIYNSGSYDIVTDQVVNIGSANGFVHTYGFGDPPHFDHQ